MLSEWMCGVFKFRSVFVALLAASLASLVAGFTLASVSGSLLEQLPGLLILVPAAIAVQGNIFGALGSRLGTLIHMGTFGLSGGRKSETRKSGGSKSEGRKPESSKFNASKSLLAQNIVVSLCLSLTTGVWLALLAKATAVVFGVSPTLSLTEFVVLSTAGGVIASVASLVITLVAACGAVRFSWDLDNVVAPLVTATADVVSVPALILASKLLVLPTFAVILGWGLIFVAASTAVWAFSSSLMVVRRVARESTPVLCLAGMVDLLAGITVESHVESFVAFPVLLVLLPGYLGTAGALGGVLSSRFASKLHLGLLRPSSIPSQLARRDMSVIFLLALPVFGILAFAAVSAGSVIGFAAPGYLEVIQGVLIGGCMVMLLTGAVAYYGTLVAVRSGLDPDNCGIPMVTSSLDLAGAFTLIAAFMLVGVM